MHSIYPWQETQWQLLLARYKNNTFPHALLLAGPQGMGKLNFAHALAELLLCNNATDIACNHCSSCHLMAAGTHPDLLLIQPEAAGKTIKIDQIRELVDIMNRTSQQGNHQIAIIEPAEAMNNAAANALLKTLEEPAKQKIIILVSHQPATLTATIRSRCQSIIFKPMLRDKMLNWLQQKMQPNEAELLLTVAEQTPLRALELSQPEYKQQREQWLNHFIQLCIGNIDPIKLAEVGKSTETKIILFYLLSLLMDIMRLKLKANSHFLVNQDRTDMLHNINPKISLENLLQLLSIVNETNQLVTRHLTLNQQLVLENLFIELQKKFNP